MNIAVRRKACHDFGHWDLRIVDKLQTAVEEVYNVEVFPRPPLETPFKGGLKLTERVPNLAYMSTRCKSGFCTVVLFTKIVQPGSDLGVCFEVGGLRT